MYPDRKGRSHIGRRFVNPHGPGVAGGRRVPGPGSRQGQLPRGSYSPRDNEAVAPRSEPPTSYLGRFDTVRNRFNAFGQKFENVCSLRFGFFFRLVLQQLHGIRVRICSPSGRDFRGKRQTTRPQLTDPPTPISGLVRLAQRSKPRPAAVSQEKSASRCK